MNNHNVWVLTEERPKPTVIGVILEQYLKEKSIAAFISEIRIIPILNENQFSFTYQVLGLETPSVTNVYLKIISGKSSFVDYLVFDTVASPSSGDVPILVIEETKTGDKESRNTGIFQRATKFVYVDYFYPHTKKIMLYNLHGVQKHTPTQTNIFGTRCFLTLGVNILGKTLHENMKPWSSIDELIEFKDSMRRPPKGNTPILISKESNNLIVVTGRLVKSGRLGHDPNIGALSLIGATLRALGWKNRIVIQRHSLTQAMLNGRNKFIRIANRYKLELDGLKLPKSAPLTLYWYYETKGEKVGTIFLHLLVESFSEGMSIYENHAGCERGYFFTSTGKHIAVKKYSDRKAYKTGNKKKIVNLPDLTLLDLKNSEIINVEGEMYKNKDKGLIQIESFDAFEAFYIKKYYPEYEVIRTVVLYGGKEKDKPKGKVSLLLNSDGDILFSLTAPKLFKEAIRNMFDYWKK